MDGADLVHSTLPLLVTGTYVTPFLFGHWRRVMNHEHVHPTNSAFSHSPLRTPASKRSIQHSHIHPLPYVRLCDIQDCIQHVPVNSLPLCSVTYSAFTAFSS